MQKTLRSTCAVVSGYLVMAALATPIFGLAYLAPEFVFEEGKAKATLSFSLSTAAVGFAAALVGGMVTAKIAGGSTRAVAVLAALVLVLGLSMSAASQLGEHPPGTTTGEPTWTTVEERMRQSREPLWYSFSMPLIGSLGVLAGGRRRQGHGKRRAEQYAA